MTQPQRTGAAPTDLYQLRALVYAAEEEAADLLVQRPMDLYSRLRHIRAELLAARELLHRLDIQSPGSQGSP